MTQKTKYEIFFHTSSLLYERQLIIYAINRRSMTIWPHKNKIPMAGYMHLLEKDKKKKIKY